MKVNREELRDILALLKPGLAKREFVQQACHFMFLGNEVVTYNDKICITHPYESDVTFSVKGEEFFRLIDGISDENITITIDKGKVKIKSKSTSATMAIISDEKNTLPEAIELVEKGRKDWEPLPDNFLEGISLCAFSVSPDLTKGVLACVGIIGDKCWSLDTARASMFKMSSKVNKDFYIVGKEAMELAKFPVIEYCVNGNWAHFRTADDVIFSCKHIVGTMPLEKMITRFDELDGLDSFTLPKELKTMVDNIVVLAMDLLDKTGKAIEVSVKNGEMFIQASNELGSVDKNLLCEYEGEIHMNINAKFFSQILEKTTKLAVKDKMLYFSSSSFRHLLMQTAVMTPKGDK